MVARGPGAVGCAHCKVIGAELACEVCTRLVCATCAADWSTCEEPSGRLVRLGMTARVLDVDPSGRIAIVSRWRGRLRVFDLRALRWTGETLPNKLNRHLGPRLTSDGRMVQATIGIVGDPFSPDMHVPELHVASLRTGTDHKLEGVGQPREALGVSMTGDHIWYATETQLVTLLSPLAAALPAHASTVSLGLAKPADDVPMTSATFEPLPRKVIQAICFDGERSLLATATWGEIILHRVADGRLERVGYAKTTGDVSWLAVAGDRIAAHVHGGHHTGITVWQLGADLSIGEVAHRLVRNVHLASLSRDGRYLAAGLDDRTVVVHRLGDNSTTTFDEHTDTIGLVRFVGDDHLLVTADHDHRMILRPRTASGYARPVMAVEVPRA